MKNRRLFWGIILLFIGVVALLASLDVFDFSWLAARKLWPLLIVIMGILILPSSDTIKAILLIITLGIGCLLYHHQAKQRNSIFDLFTTTDIRRPKTDTNNLYRYACSAWGGLICKTRPHKEPFNKGNTRLEVQMSSGKLSICGFCEELACATQGDSDLDIISTENDENTVLTVLSRKHKPHLMRGFEKPINIRLNDTPVWDFDIAAGAADIDIDLSRHKTERLDITSTTGNINVKIGKYDLDSNLTITSGVSKISITVPENTNCTIDCASPLAYKEFPDFTETSDNHWQADNNGEISPNISIKIDATAAFITVKRA